MSEIPVNPFYESNKDRGVIAAAVPPVVLILCSVVIGTYGNFRIVYVTARSRSLRGTCNYLIALCSLSDSIHMFSHVFLAYLVFSGLNFVTLETCYYVMSVPLVGVVFGQALILLVGVDRLLCTVASKRYQMISRSVYSTVVMVICVALTAFFLVIGYQNMQQMSTTPVLCAVIEALHGSPMRYYSIFSFSVVIASVLCYVIIWVYVRCSLASSGGQHAKLFKSLAVMTFIVAGCFGATYLTAILFATGENATFVHLYNGIGINIGCSCNYYVLYFTSTEYRKSFQNPGGSSVADVTGLVPHARRSVSVARLA